MPHVVHSASPRRSPIPGSVPGGRLLLAGASHGDDGHQSAKVPRGSQEGGFPPQLKGIRPIYIKSPKRSPICTARVHL